MRRTLALLAFGLSVASFFGHAEAHHERMFVQRQANVGRAHPNVRLGFMGAAGGQVTGSMHVLTVAGKRILVDAGAQQGEMKREDDAAREQISLGQALKADAIVLTHAHMDHIGRLPLLVKQGFRGAIFATPETGALVQHLLMDAAKIEGYRAQDKGREPRFTEEDVKQVLQQIQTRSFDTSFQPIPGVNVRFQVAGHILGAASLDMQIGGFGKISFSGDVGRQKSILYNKPRTSPGARKIVVESTYGDRKHPGTSPKDDLAKALNEALARGGKVIIPAFSLGRSQELLYILHQLYREGKVTVPVYFDSPLGNKVNGVYARFLESPSINPEVRKFAAKNGGNPFKWPMLREIYTRKQSMNIKNDSGPAIIIAGSGMVEGGRVIGHIADHIEDPKNTVVFVGYQGERTFGRKIAEMADGREGGSLVFRGFNGEPDVERSVRARIVQLSGFSGHGDQDELVSWTNQTGLSPKGGSHVFMTHGERSAQEALGKRLSAEGYKVSAPDHGEEHDLDGE